MHYHVWSVVDEINEMGTTFMTYKGKRCSAPECAQNDEPSGILWPHDRIRFHIRAADVSDTNYQEGYDAGYAHALEVHEIEEVEDD